MDALISQSPHSTQFIYEPNLIGKEFSGSYRNPKGWSSSSKNLGYFESGKRNISYSSKQEALIFYSSFIFLSVLVRTVCRFGYLRITPSGFSVWAEGVICK